MDTPRLSPVQEAFFPKLALDYYQVTSPEDPWYNCVAWSLGITDQWWYPISGQGFYWPQGIPRSIQVDAFITLYESFGYQLCASGQSELGFEKLALYANFRKEFLHVARQKLDGKWTSKLGQRQDIEHALLDALESPSYGTVVAIMKRATSK